MEIFEARAALPTSIRVGDPEDRKFWNDRCDYHTREIQNIKRALHNGWGEVVAKSYGGFAATVANKLRKALELNRMAYAMARNERRNPTQAEVNAALSTFPDCVRLA